MADVNPPIAALARLGLPRPLIDILNQLWIRTGGPTDMIENMELSQVAEDGGNRTYRRNRDEIDELQGMLAEQKRHSRNLEQQLHLLAETVDRVHTRNRTLEQNLNELTERVDSGT